MRVGRVSARDGAGAGRGGRVSGDVPRSREESGSFAHPRTPGQLLVWNSVSGRDAGEALRGAPTGAGGSCARTPRPARAFGAARDAGTAADSRRRTRGAARVLPRSDRA